jgi:hypothetical protein
MTAVMFDLYFVGIYPPPPAVAALMQILPPPWAFNGPFVIVDALMDTIRRYLPRTSNNTIDNYEYNYYHRY